MIGLGSASIPPNDPSEKESQRDSMTRFGVVVANDLRDLSNSPAKEADKTKTKGYLTA